MNVYGIKDRKQQKCPSSVEQINKMWYVHKMEYYSVIKGMNYMTDTYNNIDSSQKHMGSKRKYLSKS